MPTVEKTCSGCGAQKRVQQLPHGPRIINHMRAGAPELVKERRDARGLLGLKVRDFVGDKATLEKQIAAAKDAALASATDNHQRTAIFDAALAMIEHAHRAIDAGEDPRIMPVEVEVTVEESTKEPCPGSGKAPKES